MFGSKTDKIKKLAAKKNGEKIAAYLNDNSADVRLAAIEGLGVAGGEAAVNALVPLLHNPDTQIRIAAANAMGVMADPHTKAHLEYQFKRETDPKVKEALIAAQGKIKSKD